MKVRVKQAENLRSELKSAPGCFVNYSKITGRKQTNLYIKYSNENGEVNANNIEMMEEVFSMCVHSWEGFLMEDQEGNTSDLECNFDNYLLIEDEGIKKEIMDLLFITKVSTNGKAENTVKNSKAGRKS